MVRDRSNGEPSRARRCPAASRSQGAARSSRAQQGSARGAAGRRSATQNRRTSAPPSRQGAHSRPSAPPKSAAARDVKASNGRSSRGRARSDTRQPYNAPAVWTKESGGSASRLGVIGDILRSIGRILAAGCSLIGRGLARIGSAIASLFKRSRVALVGTVAVGIVLLAFFVDFGLNANKAYPGVRVGELDASGKTAEEITALVEETYGPRIAQGSIVIYASDEAAAAGQQSNGGVSIAEQQSAEEEKASRTSWTADAATLAATLPAADLAEQALAVGREEGGPFARLSAALTGWDIAVRVAYGDEELETLAASIDETIGIARVDFGIAVTEGVAAVTEGSDGEMVNREALAQQLDEILLSEQGTGSFVAHVEHAPVRADREAAQAVCDDVNAAIADGARFTSGDATWEADNATLGDWIVAVIEEREGGYALTPRVDEAMAKPSIVTFANEQRDDSAHTVSFEKAGDGAVRVRAQGMDEIPLAADTVAELNAALFGSEGKASQARAFAEGTGEAPGAEPVEIPVLVGPMPETLSLDEALDWGVVEGFSSYTTEFSTGSGTENRQHNIALVSEYLDNSIIAPGGTWSFNETSGERSAERGFLDAGAIVDGEYGNEEGGGVCQVATTVFNAVYDSGLPIVRRYNHTLYIASYPAGRDAAVSWPDLDLVWENDTESAVLMRVTCTESTVTATLYGVDPGYSTSTDVGEWEEGKKHKTRTEIDESLSSGTSYVETRGTDGSKITIVRVVKDSAGAVLHEDVFASEYDPITEVIIAAPDAPPPDADPTGEDTPDES